MAKGPITGSGPTLPLRRVAFRLKGRVNLHFYQNGIVAKAWPAKRGKRATPAQLQARADFKRMVDLVNSASASDRVGAMMIAHGSAYTWRDVLSRAVTGTLIQLDPGTAGEAMAKTMLDALGTTPGMVLVCTPDGWIALDPPAEAGVLLIDDSQVVNWADFAPLADSGVTPGSYLSTDITVDRYGRVTAAANGTGGGGGSMLTKQLAADSSQFASSVPATVTAVTGLSLNVGPYATDTTITVSVMLGTTSSQDNFRSRLLVDGSEPTPAPPKHRVTHDSDGGTVNQFSNFPVLIPGDSAAHVIDAAIEAAASTAGLTLLAGSSLAVLAP